MFKKLKILLGVLTGKYIFTGPKRIIIDIYNECGLGCIMCFYYSSLIYIDDQKKSAWQKEYISLDKFNFLLEDVEPMGASSIGICGGGEPFLHPDVFNMIEMVKRLGFECIVFTNGVYLNRDKVEYLSKIGLDRIILSLHAGDLETYKRIHPQAGNGYFEKIKDWLEYLKFLKEKNKVILPKIWHRSVITSYNYDKIDKIIDFGIQHNVDYIQFKIAGLPEGRMKDELSLNDFQRQELISILNAYKKRLNIPNNIGYFTSTLARKVNYQMSQKKSRKIQKKKTFCFVPWSGSTILADGTVLGCPYNPKVLGNINKDRFSKIWYSVEYSDFRKNLYCDGPCSAAAFSRPLNYIHRLFFLKRS